LINEAEDALVAAPPDGQGGELEAKRIIRIFYDLKLSGDAILAGDYERQSLIRCVEQKINAVIDFVAVHGNQQVTALEAVSGCCAPRQDARYF